MFANELRKKPIEELNEMLKSEGKKLEELQMQLMKQKEKNFNKVKFGRRDIARIKTVIKEKMMEERAKVQEEEKTQEEKAVVEEVVKAEKTKDKKKTETKTKTKTKGKAKEKEAKDAKEKN